MRVFAYILLVIIVDELVMNRLAEDDDDPQAQDAANARKGGSHSRWP
jgi:hypothetical protein